MARGGSYCANSVLVYRQTLPHCPKGFTTRRESPRQRVTYPGLGKIVYNNTRGCRYQRISIHTLLDGAVAAAQDRIQLKELQVVKAYAAGDGQVLVDVEKMQVAFLNIIINAVEAMEPDHGILRLQTEPKDHHCLVSITDNGTGIEADALPRLFDPYFSRKPNGTGLGLTHSYTIITTHKGAIAVESTAGRGTTFRITLPAAG